MNKDLRRGSDWGPHWNCSKKQIKSLLLIPLHRCVYAEGADPRNVKSHISRHEWKTLFMHANLICGDLSCTAVAVKSAASVTVPVYNKCSQSQTQVSMKSNFERVNPNLAVLIAGSKIKKRRTAVRGKRTVGLTGGRMAGGRGGLPAKRAVTCWVCNWWAEKSTAFCLLPVSLHLQRSALITRFSRDLKVFFSASQTALTYSIIRTLKCMPADLWEMSPASDCVRSSHALWHVSFRNFSTVLWVLAAWLAWFWTAAFYFTMLMVLFLCRGIAAQL